MSTLKDELLLAKQHSYALGHFNFSDSTQFNAIAGVALELNVPILLGVSEGEKKFIGIENALSLVRAARKARGTKLFLNLDHGHSIEACKEAIDLGFDSVMFDGSHLPYEENLAKTKEVVEYARKVGEKQERYILVEGELGYIGSSSKLLDEVPEDAGLEKTTPEQAQDFVAKTGVDILAPSVGNIHGMLKGASNPELDTALIAQIRKAVPDTFLVLHGGSGIKDDEFKLAIKNGINIVHINTEIRKAYRFTLEETLQNKPEEVAPYKFLSDAKEAVKKQVQKRVELFTLAK